MKINLLPAAAMVAALAMSACGGGGGSSPPEMILLGSSDARLAQSGDARTYDFQATVSDPFSETELRGVIIETVGAADAVGEQEVFFELNNVIDTPEVLTTATETYLQDAGGATILIINDEGCLLTVDDFDAGIQPRKFPGNYTVGDSSNVMFDLLCPNQSATRGDYVAQISYTVLGREFVSTPLGDFEAYRMSFRASFDDTSILGTDFTEEGLRWVVPEIGVVRERLTYTDNAGDGATTIVSERVLADTNIPY